MLTSHELKIRKEQQIQELRHRLQYSNSMEEKQDILQQLNFWTRYSIPVESEIEEIPTKIPGSLINTELLQSLKRWFSDHPEVIR